MHDPCGSATMDSGKESEVLGSEGSRTGRGFEGRGCRGHSGCGSHCTGRQGPCTKHPCPPGLCSLLASGPFPPRADERSGVLFVMSLPLRQTCTRPRAPLTQSGGNLRSSQSDLPVSLKPGARPWPLPSHGSFTLTGENHHERTDPQTPQEHHGLGCGTLI